MKRSRWGDFIVAAGPSGRRKYSAHGLGAVLSCLALLSPHLASAQSLTPDLFNPERGNFVAPQELPLRKIGDTADPALDPDRDVRRGATPAPSRIGRVPSYGLPAASGAADTGYDSLSRKRRQPAYYPAQPRPKPAPGPGTSPPAPPQLRLSIPPSQTANKPPVAPALGGTVDGQPPRKRLKQDDDPFGAVGDHAGGFLVKSSVELSGGYDSNPGRTFEPHGLPFYVVAPEFLAVSDWERHALVADLRGSFTGYGGTLPATLDGQVNPAPTTIDRPDFTGHVDGRFDVGNDTDLTAEARLRVGTDNPGSPNIQAGLAKYPIYTTLGSTVGFDQRWNRLQISAGATIDRTSYQDSTLTDGAIWSNQDRDFNQYGGVGRVSYELTPGLKPFAEVEGDARVHDLRFDDNGYERDSSGGYAKAGTSFEFSRLLTGEFAVGWAERSYIDPRLNRLDGLLTSGSLLWSATPLTTAKLICDTQIAETTLPGSAGVLVHTYTVELDHDFSRWLTGIGKFTYGTFDYQGIGRDDKTYAVEGDLIYKMTRNLWIKGTLRRDRLDSNVPLSSSAGTVAMLGVRLQN